MPGVLAAGISTNATPPDSGWVLPVEILGKPASQAQEAHVEFVSPEYFATLQVPLLRGRPWDQSEIARGATLVLVNQAFVRHYLSGEDALGHSVRISQLTNTPPYRLAATEATDGCRSSESSPIRWMTGCRNPRRPPSTRRTPSWQ